MWIEPSAVARMSRNGWLATDIARVLGMHPLAVGEALRRADVVERGVDHNTIIRSRVQR